MTKERLIQLLKENDELTCCRMALKDLEKGMTPEQIKYRIWYELDKFTCKGRELYEWAKDYNRSR